MKNEVFARAMTDIDDDLIAEARTVGKARIFAFPVRRIAAVAACAVFTVAVVAVLLSGGVKMTVCGEEELPVIVDTAVALDESVRTVSSGITVPIEFDSRRKTTVEAQDGIITVISPNGETLYSGTKYEGKGDFSVEWTVREPEPETTYTVTVNGESLTLGYDGVNWIVE